MPQASVRTSISPVAGSGSGNVSTTSWDPRMTAARMSRISPRAGRDASGPRVQRSLCRATRAHAGRRRWAHRDPRPRGARGERLPRSQSAGEPPARVRGTGGGPGAGRRGPHRRSRHGALPARVLPPPRRPGEAHPLHGGPHPRRPEVHHPARGRHPARRGHLQPGRVLPARGDRPGARGRDAGGTRSGDPAELRGAPRARCATRFPPRRWSGPRAIDRSRRAPWSGTTRSGRRGARRASWCGSAPAGGCRTICSCISAWSPTPPTCRCSTPRPCRTPSRGTIRTTSWRASTTRCGSIAPFRADEWLLYAQESPAAHGARGFTMGHLFTRDGRLVASVAQEGLIRPLGPAAKRT